MYCVLTVELKNQSCTQQSFTKELLKFHKENYEELEQKQNI